MPEEIDIDTDKLHEAIEEEMEKEGGGLLRTIALTTSIFAAIAAIAALQAGGTVNEALIRKTHASQLQAQASDAWAFYQAKSIKSAIVQTQEAVWTAQHQPVPPALQAAEQRYNDEQAELNKKARELEKQRDESNTEAEHLMHQHHAFANAVALFQVAIALGAVAALTRKRPLWWASMLLGIIGMALIGRIFMAGGVAF